MKNLLAIVMFALAYTDGIFVWAAPINPLGKCLVSFIVGVVFFVIFAYAEKDVSGK